MLSRPKVSQSTLITLLSSIILASLIYIASISSATWSWGPIWASEPEPAYTGEPSTVLVGPRRYGPFYYGRGCSSSELLSSFARARIRDDGASRHVSTGDLGDYFSVPKFNVSFDLGTCPPLHVFSSAEACDLVGAYGGLMLSGDSFVRHLTNALFILLSGRNDGALKSERDFCRGERTFIDKEPHCRLLVYKNSEAVPEKLCGGNVFVRLDEKHEWRTEAAQSAVWDPLMEIVPAEKRSRSPISFESHGIHFSLQPELALNNYIRPLVARFRDVQPRPVMLWGSIHAPPPNKPKQFLAEQGPIPTQNFNARIQDALEAMSPGPMVGLDGPMKQVDWYNITDGAESFDGGHYSYQINIEKALIILNVLDAVWGEARRAGGLIHS